jgi:hypothetical protein
MLNEIFPPNKLSLASFWLRIFEEKLRQRIKAVSSDTALFFEQIFTKKTKPETSKR